MGEIFTGYYCHQCKLFNVSYLGRSSIPDSNLNRKFYYRNKSCQNIFINEAQSISANVIQIDTAMRKYAVDPSLEANAEWKRDQSYNDGVKPANYNSQSRCQFAGLDDKLPMTSAFRHRENNKTAAALQQRNNTRQSQCKINGYNSHTARARR